MNTSQNQDRVIDGRYRIIRSLAAGGMARVFLAEDTRLKRQVAVKVIHPHLADDESFIAQFRQEAILAANLSHPNLVNVFDQGTDSGSAYLVMEYVAGQTLRQVIKEFGPLSPKRTLGVLESVLAGLSAAHSDGILHRDIKPENVLLADDGRIKLSDFGLARPISAHTETDSVIGTAAYLSPELASRGLADARSDVYAVGILCFELLTGKQPFTGDVAAAVAAQHLNSTVPAPSTLVPGLPESIDELVLWATERDAALRPANAGELLEFVRKVASELRGEASAPKPTAGNRTEVISPQVENQNQTMVLDSNATQILEASAADQLTQVISVDGPVSNDETELPFSSFNGGKFWRWVVSTLLVFALAAGLGWWFGAGPGALRSLPELKGRTVAAAQGTLTNLGLIVLVVNEHSADVAQGLVTRTEPNSGSLVASGTELKIFVSLGPELKVVPVLTGLNVAEATIEITKAGAGQVFDYLGSDKQKLPVGSDITINVSLGPLPLVENLSQDVAVSLLTTAGLTVAEVKAEYSDTVPAGNVISMTPQTQPLGESGSVSLTVSKGSDKVIVPKVVGETIAAAKSALEALGLRVTVDTNQLSSRWGIAKVKSASVKAGTTLRRGDAVTIVSR
jgi:serine/threonine-protein kinase